MSDPELDRAELGSVVAEFRSATITREMLRQYAEASGDLNPLHLDPAFAQKAGFPDVIAHGMLGMGYLGQMLIQRFSSKRLQSFEARFAGVVPLGETIRCVAKVKAIEIGSVLLDLQAETSTGSIAITGQARVATA